MPQLFYSHDPMCSFCWAFRPAWAELTAQLPDGYNIVTLVGGLASDNDAPMSESMREKLQATWRAIQKRIPGTTFNFDFWQQCQARRSTYPSCRAVVAAKLLDPEKEDDMIFGIQTAYYLRAENPSNNDTLIKVAQRIGLDPKQFEFQLHHPTTEQQFNLELAQSRALGISSFPSIVWAQSSDKNARRFIIPIDYNNADTMIELINSIETRTNSHP